MVQRTFPKLTTRVCFPYGALGFSKMTYWISVKSFFSLNATLRWFCHVDDDNYVNVRTLVKLLSQYQHTQDMYIGKPSLDRPIEATERLGDNKMVCQSFFFTNINIVDTLLLVSWTRYIDETSCFLFKKSVNFWFATGGAGFCVSRGLALKMSPWARWGHMGF